MKRPFAICRVGKVSGWAAISAMSAHHIRARATPNADPARQPICLIGTGDPGRDVRALIEGLGIRPRTNGVLTVEHLLTASPEYFRPNRPHAYGEYDGKQLEPWVAANLRWLQDRYAGRLVSAVLHVDEATPHIHAAVVPIEQKLDRRRRPPSEVWTLNARGLVGDARKLRCLQDEYASALSHLGLNRGIERSLTGASHVAIRQFYQNPQRSLLARAEAERRPIIQALGSRKQKYRELIRDYRELRLAIAATEVADQDGYDWLESFDGKRAPIDSLVENSETCSTALPQPHLSPTTIRHRDDAPDRDSGHSGSRRSTRKSKTGFEM